MNGKPLPSNAEIAACAAMRDGQLVRQANEAGGLMPATDLARLWLRICNGLTAARTSDAGRAASIRALSDGELLDLAIIARDGLPVIVAAAEAVMANYGPGIPRDQRALADHQLTVAVYRVLDAASRERLKGTPQ